MNKKTKYVFLVINILIITVFINVFIFYYKEYKLNKELLNSKEEYLKLNEDIERYTKLKEEVDIINNENINLNDKVVSLKTDIDSKNSSVTDYNNKISDLYNKISILTGEK